jgi:TonB family protein
MSTLAAQPVAGHASVIDWVLPGKPLRVELSGITLLGMQLSVKQRLQRHPHLRPGGLLLGTCVRSPAWKITVERQLPLEWDAGRGGAPFLTQAQRQALHRTSVASFTEAKIVGVYRLMSTAQDAMSAVHGAPDEVLTDEDRHLLDSCSLFPIALEVCLAGDDLDPHGFAFWEDSNVYELVSVPHHVSRQQHAERPFLVVRDEPIVPLRSPEPNVRTRAIREDQTPESKPDRKTNVKRVWPVPSFVPMILISMLAFTAGYLGFKPLLQNLGSHVVPHPARASNANLPSPALGLKVTRRGPALEISWDQSSSVIRSARSGKLALANGQLNRSINLDRDRLLRGRIIYDTSDSGDVTCRLEVTDSASRSSTELLRIISEPPKSQAALSVVDERQKHTATLSSAQKQADPQLAKASYKEPARDGRVSQPQPTTSSSRPVLPSDSHVHSSTSLNAKKFLIPARVLTPYYPNAWLDSETALDKDVFVSVIVEINEAGEVSSAALTEASARVSPYLGNQVLNAARRWRFSPATQNGQPVRSQREIRFHFSPPG